MSILSRKINYLAKNNYKITILSVINHEHTFYNISEDVNIISIGSKSGLIPKIISFIKFIRNNAFDIIVSVDARYITWILPYVTNVPIVAEVHQSYDGLKDYYKRASLSSLNQLFHSILFRWTYPKYDRMIVLTEEDKTKWNYKNIEVIPNFHNLSTNKLNIPKKKIVCLGRFHHQKGYDMMIEIWKIVACRFPDWLLCYYGVESNDFVVSELSKYKAPVSFKIMGKVNNLDAIFSDAYINIVPSRSESFSLSLLEAMCYGVPTVSFDTTGPKSLIINNHNGVLIKSYDIKASANAIISLINNIETRQLYSNNCLLLANNYTQSTIMGKWINLYNSLQR